MARTLTRPRAELRTRAAETRQSIPESCHPPVGRLRPPPGAVQFDAASAASAASAAAARRRHPVPKVKFSGRPGAAPVPLYTVSPEWGAHRAPAAVGH